MIRRLKNFVRNWKRIRYLETQLEITTRVRRLTVGEQQEALRLLTTEPLYTYLLAWMDELMRHSVYLEEKYTPDHVRFLVDRMSDLLAEAKQLEKRELTEGRRKEKPKD